MAVVINGTNGVEAQTGGFLADSTYGGSFTAGTVVDYTSSLGRISVGSGADLAFYRGGIATTEAMRIKSNGQLLLQGNTAEATNLATSASNAAILLRPYTGSSWATAFGSYSGQIQYIQGVDAAGTTARDITIQPFGGNVLVGTTTNGGGGGISLQPSATTPGLAMVGSGTSGGAGFNLYSSGTSNYRFYVDWGGVIHAISTSISAISDATVKENVRDLETGLKEVMELQPRRFDFINGDGKDVAGFIAQEVEKVLPDLVSDSPYSKDEEGNDIYKKNLKMGDMLPTLVKAIQEQQELIKALTSRIETLEAK